MLKELVEFARESAEDPASIRSPWVSVVDAEGRELFQTLLVESEVANDKSAVSYSLQTSDDKVHAEEVISGVTFDMPGKFTSEDISSKFKQYVRIRIDADPGVRLSAWIT